MPVYRGPDGKIIEEKTNSGKDVNQSPDSEQRPPAPTGRGQTSQFWAFGCTNPEDGCEPFAIPFASR